MRRDHLRTIYETSKQQKLQKKKINIEEEEIIKEITWNNPRNGEREPLG